MRLDISIYYVEGADGINCKVKEIIPSRGAEDDDDDDLYERVIIPVKPTILSVCPTGRIHIQPGVCRICQG